MSHSTRQYEISSSLSKSPVPTPDHFGDLGLCVSAGHRTGEGNGRMWIFYIFVVLFYSTITVTAWINDGWMVGAPAAVICGGICWYVLEGLRRHVRWTAELTTRLYGRRW